MLNNSPERSSRTRSEPILVRRSEGLRRPLRALPAFVFGRLFAATPTVGPLSRRGLRVGEEAAKPSSENGAGLGVGPADVAGRLHESVVGGGSVQFVDVLLGGDGGELW